uniref:Nitrogen permease regulator 2 n=1 Tax=Dracunculus medinensis TaxID=318479 RepID=A0A0N4UQM6_DRAME
LLCIVPLSLVIKSYDDLDALIYTSRRLPKTLLLAKKISLSGLLGAWFGAFFIPLDWDRWWQRWPLPCIFCAFFVKMPKFQMPSALNTFFPHSSGVPKLKAIIFAEFDSNKGPVITFQVPKLLFDAKNFDTFSSAIITKPELFQRLIKVNHVEDNEGHVFKVMGHAIGIESEQYPRGRYIFNLCFVVDKESNVDCMYEPMVQKCAAYLTQLETENNFLSRSKDELPNLMLAIFEGLNAYGECKIPVADRTVIYLKLCPSFHGIEPPKVNPYMVPMFKRMPPPKLSCHLTKMDILSQKIITMIDGVRCIKDISLLVQIDVDLVARCVRHLHFYGFLALLPLFMYSNSYVATEKLHDFYLNTDIHESCLDFVGIRRGIKSFPVTRPTFTDVFRLYASLKIGFTMKEWCERFMPRRYNVHERRLIQFGLFHGFIRKLSVYPVALKKDDRLKYAKYCDGSFSTEDIAVMHSMSPLKLFKILQDDGNYVFISK